jgi:hypothetical protein
VVVKQYCLWAFFVGTTLGILTVAGVVEFLPPQILIGIRDDTNCCCCLQLRHPEIAFSARKKILENIFSTFLISVKFGQIQECPGIDILF